MIVLIAVDAVAMAISEGEPETTTAAADDAESLHESEAVSLSSLGIIRITWTWNHLKSLGIIGIIENENGMLTAAAADDAESLHESEAVSLLSV